MRNSPFLYEIFYITMKMGRVKQCYNKTQSQYATEQLPERPRTPRVLLDDCKYIYEVKWSLNTTLERAGGKLIKENLPSGDTLTPTGKRAGLEAPQTSPLTGSIQLTCSKPSAFLWKGRKHFATL